MPIRPSFAVSPFATIGNAYAAGKHEQRRYLDQLQLNVAQMQQRERLARMQMAANMYTQGQSQNAAMQRMQFGAALDYNKAQMAAQARNDQIAQDFANRKELMGIDAQNRVDYAKATRSMDMTSAADSAMAQLEMTLGKYPDEALSEQGIQYRKDLEGRIKDFKENKLPTAVPEDRLYWANEMLGRAQALEIPRFRRPPEESMTDRLARESVREKDGTVWTYTDRNGWERHLPPKDQANGSPKPITDPNTGNQYIVTPDGKTQLTLDMQKLSEDVASRVWQTPDAYMGYQLDENGNEITEVVTGQDENGQPIMGPAPMVIRPDKFEQAYNAQMDVMLQRMRAEGSKAPPETPSRDALGLSGGYGGQRPSPGMRQPPAMPPAQGGDGASAPPMMPPQGSAPVPPTPPATAPPGAPQGAPPATPGQPPQGAPAQQQPWPQPTPILPDAQARVQQKADIRKAAEIARKRFSDSPLGRTAVDTVEKLLDKYGNKPLQEWSEDDHRNFNRAMDVIKAEMGQTPTRGEY